MTKGEWSGWMQAIFSVLAILGAVGIAGWQLKTQHEREMKTLMAKGQMIADTLRTNLLYAETWLKEMSGRLNRAKESGAVYRTEGDVVMAGSVVLPTDEQLLHITSIWPEAAGALVKYRGGVELIREMLDAVQQHRDANFKLPEGEVEHFQRICMTTRVMLKQALDSLPLSESWKVPVEIPADM